MPFRAGNPAAPDPGAAGALLRHEIRHGQGMIGIEVISASSDLDLAGAGEAPGYRPATVMPSIRTVGASMP